jgi:hypothetical protein
MSKPGLFYTAFSSDFAIAQATTYDIDGHQAEVVEYMIRFEYMIRSILSSTALQTF